MGFRRVCGRGFEVNDLRIIVFVRFAFCGFKLNEDVLFRIFIFEN